MSRGECKLSKKRLTREESQQKTRTKLLNVAANMFAEHGFYDTSIDRIAEEAGFSKGAVYSNFGSKDDLFIEVFRDQQRKDMQDLEKIIESCETIDEFIQLLEKNHEHGRKVGQKESILKLEFLLHALRNKAAQKSLADMLKENRQQMVDILQHFYKEDNSLSPGEADRLAYLILSLDIGIGIQSFVLAEDTPDKALAEGLKLFLKIK